MFITYIQLAIASLKVSSEVLRARSSSKFAHNASASSASSARAGSKNPRPCGAWGCAPERECTKKEPCETRRSGYRCGVGPDMNVCGLRDRALGSAEREGVYNKYKYEDA